MGSLRRNRDLPKFASANRLRFGEAHPGYLAFDEIDSLIYRPSALRCKMVDDYEQRRSRSVSPFVDPRPLDAAANLRMHSLINKRTFTTLPQNHSKLEQAFGKTRPSTPRGPLENNSTLEQAIGKTRPSTPRETLGASRRPPQLPSKEAAHQESPLAGAGARMAFGPRSAPEGLRARQRCCSPRPTSVQSSSCSSNSSQPESGRESKRCGSRKRVSFDADCKPAPPATLKMILSLCRSTSEETPELSSNIGAGDGCNGPGVPGTVPPRAGTPAPCQDFRGPSHNS